MYMYNKVFFLLVSKTAEFLNAHQSILFAPYTWLTSGNLCNSCGQLKICTHTWFYWGSKDPLCWLARQLGFWMPINQSYLFHTLDSLQAVCAIVVGSWKYMHTLLSLFEQQRSTFHISTLHFNSSGWLSRYGNKITTLEYHGPEFVTL